MSIVQQLILGVSAIGWAALLWFVLIEPVVGCIKRKLRARKLARGIEVPMGRERL